MLSSFFSIFPRSVGSLVDNNNTNNSLIYKAQCGCNFRICVGDVVNNNNTNNSVVVTFESVFILSPRYPQLLPNELCHLHFMTL